MNSLFARTLAATLTALMALVAVLAVIFMIGFRESLSRWNESKLFEVETAALSLLSGRADPGSVVVSEDSPLFIYDADYSLVFSNRGGGRRGAAAESDLKPIRAEGEIVGYYHLGSISFQNNEANDAFLSSMGNFIVVGLSSALVIAVVLSLFFSKGLSGPAAALARGIERIREGELDVRVRERGAAELSLIARSVNALAVRLSREQEIRRQWVHDISHDLRTPVSAVKAQFEAMIDGVLPIDRKRIEKNMQEIERIEELVSSLEELMRLESPEMRLNVSEFTAAELFGDLTERFELEAGRKGITIETAAGGVTLSGDRGLLLRAVSNFLSNAVRHTVENGVITLSAEVRGSKVSLRVADTGEGIPPGELEKVFQRLYRGEYARKSPGSGLGLTIARRIAELHGGTVGIANREVKGVEVELSIPCRTA